MATATAASVQGGVEAGKHYGNPLEDSNTISLQDLVKIEPVTAVPKQYVRLDDERLPTDNTASIETPIIDWARLVAGGEETRLELDKLHQVCKEWGLFQLVNHKVKRSVLEQVKVDLERFHNLPLEERLKTKIRPNEFEGYGNAKEADAGYLDWNDKLYMVVHPPQRRIPYLFPNLPAFLRETLESFFVEMRGLGNELLKMMAKNLKIEEKEVIYEDGVQSFRSAMYPPCPQPELVHGLYPHSDTDLLTILHQVNGVDGFEIKKDGVWYPVSFLPDALIVNVGDLLEILSNGAYHSMEHRATPNKEKERVSIAYFILPSDSAMVGPSPSLLGPNNPPIFRTVGMDTYVRDFYSHKFPGRQYLEYNKLVNHPNSNSNSNSA